MLLLGGMNNHKFAWKIFLGTPREESNQNISEACYIMQLSSTLNNQLELPPSSLFRYGITWFIYFNRLGAR